jgi:hypothetical protein
LPTGVKTGNTYSTQVFLQYEKGRHLTTSYRRGFLAPSNTQVQLQEITSNDILLEIIPAHTKLRIDNMEKHTGGGTSQAFSKLFARNKVDLSGFSELEREHIMTGKAAKTMQKKNGYCSNRLSSHTDMPTIASNQ